MRKVVLSAVVLALVVGIIALLIVDYSLFFAQNGQGATNTPWPTEHDIPVIITATASPTPSHEQIREAQEMLAEVFGKIDPCKAVYALGTVANIEQTNNELQEAYSDFLNGQGQSFDTSVAHKSHARQSLVEAFAVTCKFAPIIATLVASEKTPVS